jgi:subtilisin family serine protease
MLKMLNMNWVVLRLVVIPDGLFDKGVRSSYSCHSIADIQMLRCEVALNKFVSLLFNQIMKNLYLPIVLFSVLCLCLCKPLMAQPGFIEYADSTQMLLYFDNEQDTAAIRALKDELQATELGVTPFTRIHLWQIPPDTVAAYGGVSGILNHAIGRPRIKGGSMNYSVPIIFNIDNDDDDDDPSVPQSPLCYNDTIYDCIAGSTAVNMAFLDTGFDGEPTGTRAIWNPSHNQFRNRPWQNSGESGKNLNVDNDKNGFTDDVKGWDFHFNDNLPIDDNGHGSHTAGIAALRHIANADSGRNKILMLKTHNQAGEGSMWQLVQALDYALLTDIKVVNMSLAYWAPLNANGKPTIMEYLIDFAKTYKGMLFVAAAGNDSINIDQPVTLSNGIQLKYCPAALPNDNLIVVAAGTCSNQLASFSNYGPVNVDIAAPGIEIYSALLDGTYGYLTGTSMAAPHVTAAAALAGSKQSSFNWKRIKYDLMNRTTPSSALSGLLSSGRMLSFCDNYISGPSPLLVTARANKVLCAGGSSTLSASASGGQAPYVYSWSNGSSGANSLVTTPGSYTVTVTDALGSTATETIQVYSAAAPFAVFNLQPVGCGESCTNLEIVNVMPGAAYLWSTNQRVPVIRICPGSQSTYSVTTTTANGCTSVTAVTIPRLQPRLTALRDTSICPCSQITLTAQAQGGFGPLNYQWSPGSATTSSITVAPSVSETYTVEVEDSRGCEVTSSATVTPACFAPVAVSAVFNPQTQRTVFTWRKGPCSINRTQIRWRCNAASPWTTVTINDTTLTTRAITLPAGCVPEWQVRSRCCNNVNSVWSSPAASRISAVESIEESSAPSFRIYPNPASAVAYLEPNENSSDNNVYIYNAWGQLVLEQPVPAVFKTTPLDIRTLLPGLYYIRYGHTVRSIAVH